MVLVDKGKDNHKLAKALFMNHNTLNAGGYKNAANQKKVALFGSYGWGDGQWMRDWEETCQNAGVTLACEPVIANEAPDDEAVAACKALGAALA